MKKRQIKSFDGSFPSETSLSFLILAHVLRHNNKTPTYKQCLLLLNKSRPSPASRPPRFRYVLLLLLYFLIFIILLLLLLLLRDEEEDGDGRWWTSSSKMCNISFDARALVRCTKCSRNAPNMNERAHVHPFLLYVRVLSRIVRIVHPFSPRLYFQTKIARIPFEILVFWDTLPCRPKEMKKNKKWKEIFDWPDRFLLSLK